MQSTDSGILIKKLDEFIRKYYKNQLIKGAIYSSGTLLAAFMSVVLLEYFGEFNTTVRGIMFFGFLLTSIGILVKYIAIPLLKLNHIGQVISYDQAASIIGNHFGNVQDKLLNVLQLQNNRGLAGSSDLLMAGINQKINELRPVPFTMAIDLGENKKYLRYVIPVFLASAAAIIIWPQAVGKSTNRLVHYQTYYEKEMPFSFNIINPELKALQTQDFKLQVKVGGEQIPGEVYIVSNGIEYRLDKQDKLNFSYNFTNLQSNVQFQLRAAGYDSKEFTLEVLPKPSLLQFNLQLVYPAYLNRPNESLSNTGDIQIPQGTKVGWTFNTRNTESIHLKFADSLASPVHSTENSFAFARRFLYSNNYTIKTLNHYVKNAGDSVNYSINVIPDQVPAIDVQQKNDSTDIRNIFFSGQIKDDYGFSNLSFRYTHSYTDSSGKEQNQAGTMPVAFSRTNISQAYYYSLDVSQFNLQPGDKIEYYFEVTDNDGVNGPKSSRTQMLVFKAPTRDELSQEAERDNTELKKDIEESLSKSKQIQKEISELLKKINDKKQLGYEEKKKLDDLMKKQQELQNKIDEVKQQSQQNMSEQNQFNQTDESILEKQQQLQQLFENVMTPEMKKLFDELNKMMDKLDRNQVQEKLEELKLTNKDIEKELDRNLEAFKQLELEQKMQNAIEKLDALKQQEENLNKLTEGKKPENKDTKKEDPAQNNKPDDKSTKPDSKDPNDKSDQAKNDDTKNNDTKPDNKEGKQESTDKKNTSPEDLAKKQEEIKKQFEELKKDIKDIEKKNSELEEPNKLPDTDQKQEDVSKDMQNSSEQLSKNNKKNASKSQKDAIQKMNEMMQQMESAMEEEEEKQDGENAKTLRQILENLVNLSFSQEELMKDLTQTRTDNPRYVAIPRQQNKLKDDSKIIEDSLLALSKRVPQISALVNREIRAIHTNMEKTVKSLADRNTGDASTRMQLTMKSVNDLALLLNENLDNMQNQMKMKMQSKSQKKGKCKKPGSGSGKNPSSSGNPVSSMRKLQEQLNKQLKEMKEAMEKGQKPGEKPGNKPGEKPGNGMGQNGLSGGYMPGSEQFAKMAAQQEALRRQMEALMSKLKNNGRDPGGDAASLMEQTEKDLVNKQLNDHTLTRQQLILTRLLESEKAEQEREQDEQRKSNEAKTQNFSNPESFLEYKRLKQKEMELLNTVPPGLTPYYKERVNNYFNSLSK